MVSDTCVLALAFLGLLLLPWGESRICPTSLESPSPLAGPVWPRVMLDRGTQPRTEDNGNARLGFLKRCMCSPGPRGRRHV